MDLLIGLTMVVILVVLLVLLIIQMNKLDASKEVCRKQEEELASLRRNVGLPIDFETVFKSGDVIKVCNYLRVGKYRRIIYAYIRERDVTRAVQLPIDVRFLDANWNLLETVKTGDYRCLDPIPSSNSPWPTYSLVLQEEIDFSETGL